METPQPPMSIEELEAMAVNIRCDIIEMICTAKAGHPGGSLSAADVVTALYFRVMNIDPKNPDWPDRDRFILSKATPVRSGTLPWPSVATSISPIWAPCARSTASCKATRT